MILNDTTISGERRARGRVFLIEPCPIIERATVSLINGEKDLELCGCANGCRAAITMLEMLRPDLILLGTPFQSRGGLELLKTLKVAFPDQPVLIFALDDEALFAPQALREGAAGYVMKREPTDTLLAAIRRVLSGGTYISKQLRERERKQSLDTRRPALHPLDTLNERELEVFRLIGQGRERSDIARRLGLKPKAVDHLRAGIKSKLCLTSSSDLMRHAMEFEREICATTAPTPSTNPA